MAQENVPFLRLEPGVGDEIKSFLSAHEVRRPIRIDLGFSGCCDSSLCLRADTARPDDRMEILEGITFVISPQVNDLVGDIKIASANKEGKPGFILTSTRPVNEWEGLGACDIKI